MSSERRIAVITGVFFIVAAVSAVVGLALYGDILSNPDYVALRSAADGKVFMGGFSELILAVSVIGTAVTVFPIVRKENEGVALGYVAGRVVEATIILVGVISLLSIVSLRQAST